MSTLEDAARAALGAMYAQEEAEMQRMNCEDCSESTRDWSVCAQCSEFFGPAIDKRHAAVAKLEAALRGT